MKWIFLSFAILTLPVHADQQYTESTCILLKQQVADYKRRLGMNSSLYVKSKNNLDNFCQQPVIAKTTKQNIVDQPVLSTNDKYTIDKQVKITQPNNEAIVSNPLASVFKALMPLFVLTSIGLLALLYFRKKLPQIKGYIGERYVTQGLTKHLNEMKYTILNDVTLPLEDGGTTQVDHIVVSNFGIFVIETKNMSGWIFGSENQAKWTQTIHRSKHSFQNPLRQNFKHTKTLSLLLNLPHDQFHSIVIFTPNAELKTKMPSSVGYLKNALTFIKTFQALLFDDKEKAELVVSINAIKLAPNRKTDRNHVKYLKEQYNNKVS